MLPLLRTSSFQHLDCLHLLKSKVNRHARARISATSPPLETPEALLFPHQNHCISLLLHPYLVDWKIHDFDPELINATVVNLYNIIERKHDFGRVIGPLGASRIYSGTRVTGN